MAGGFSKYTNDNVLNWMRGTTFPAAPTHLYVGLHTADPTDLGTGTECSYTGYSRVAVVCATGFDTVADGGGGRRMTNNGSITFGAPTSTEADPVTHGGYWNAPSPPRTAPTATEGAAGNVNVGEHTWAITFVANTDKESMAGVTVMEEVTTSAKTVDLASVPLGPTGTAARKVYRSTAGTTTPLKLVGTIADNTTTTFADNIADASLGANSPSASGSLVIYGELSSLTITSGDPAPYIPDAALELGSGI